MQVTVRREPLQGALARELKRMYVQPPARGRRVAAALLTPLEAVARVLRLHAGVAA